MRNSDQSQLSSMNRAARCDSAQSQRCGFSIVELLVVMALIALLLAIAIPAVTQSRATARRAQCRNNLRNIGLAIMESEQTHGRLPASGYHYDQDGIEALHHSWAVSILPWIDQRALYDQWDFEKPITDPANQDLARSWIPVYVCPVDISRSRERNRGDLSYTVNGGVGFTVRYAGVGDCPVDRNWTPLDLNGNGVTCPDDPDDDGEPSDRTLFKRMGVFFMENWNEGGTVRHHALADLRDGLSQTFLVTENVRVGFDPEDSAGGFASPSPYRCAFYVGNPCPGGGCRDGVVNYAMSNAGDDRINSGLNRPEGRTPVPNSFHRGGVHMCYADGHVAFLSESIDGPTYAALASPQGTLLDSLPLQQIVVSNGF